jgi:hypothetical protein
MTILFANNASTTIAGSISSIDTTVTLQSGTIFPHPLSVGDYFVATFYDQATKTLNEIVHVTHLSGNIATIVRGQEGTTPLAWSAGDIFANLVTAGTLEAFLQQGAVPINTTDVYVGDDVSTNPNHIICNTVPVPSGYALGMLFVIRVKNNNSGATDCSFNGVPAILAKRTDGSDLIGGDLYAAQESLFVYNGTFFQTTYQPVPQQAPVLTFYVRSDSTSVVDSNGLESNSGFFNTPTDAFKTIQGALNTIKYRYISTLQITIRVADGTYSSGVYDDSQYITSWNIVGNTASPGNCIINATSTSTASYVPRAFAGICVACGQHSHMTINGFTFQSYDNNARCNGWLNILNCNLNAPLSGAAAAIYASFGLIRVTGNITYSAANTIGAIFYADSGGVIQMGWSDIYGPQNLSLHMNGSYNLGIAVIYSNTGGFIDVVDNVLTVSGSVLNAKSFYAELGGYLHFAFNQSALGPIANQPGGTAPTIPSQVGGTLY